MDNIVFALACLLVALTIQHTFLHSRERQLRAKQQAFRFHALRDELQFYALEGKLSEESRTYVILMSTLNTAIKNAGLMKLREILQMAQKVEKKVPKKEFVAFVADIEKHDREVRKLAARIMISFAVMLVANDWLARCGLYVRARIESSRKALKPILRLIDRLGSSIIPYLSPTRLQVVKKARRYDKLGHRFASC